MDAVRKAYHRAVQIPLDNVERLWQELEAFETALNKITVRLYMYQRSTFLTIVGQKIHGGSLTRPHASPHRPSPTPKASRTTFPTSSTVDADKTSPVPAFVAYFQSPGESACWSLEGVLEMGGEQSAGG
jgi:hypothetical protein